MKLAAQQNVIESTVIQSNPCTFLDRPWGFQGVDVPYFKKIGTWSWQGFQPYTLAARAPRKYYWYRFLLGHESNRGPYCDRKTRSIFSNFMFLLGHESNRGPYCDRKTRSIFSNFMFFFRKSYRLWDNVEKYGEDRQTTYGNVIRHMRLACWVTRATNTHTQVV